MTATLQRRYTVNRRLAFLIPVMAVSMLWAASATAQDLKPRKPYECRGQTDKVQIHSAGVAIEVHGNCTLTIKNSRIHGGKRAIRVHGNGTLNIRNTKVFSTKVAVHTHGNGTTNAKNSKFHGKTKGNGDFNKTAATSSARRATRGARPRRRPSRSRPSQ